MATSGVITSSMTVREVITKALRLLGVTPIGETPQAEETQEAMESLNWMLKTMQADGCNLFREFEDTATFAADTATVTLAPRVLDVMEARRVISTSSELPLARWETGEYRQIPNKTASGNPVAYTLSKGVSSITMTVWPVPSASTDIKYTASRIIDDVTALDETIDLPQEWTEAVYYNLAARLIEPFSVMTTDPGRAQRIDAAAGALYQKLIGSDRPASVFFG